MYEANCGSFLAQASPVDFCIYHRPWQMLVLAEPQRWHSAGVQSSAEGAGHSAGLGTLLVPGCTPKEGSVGHLACTLPKGLPAGVPGVRS